MALQKQGGYGNACTLIPSGSSQRCPFLLHSVEIGWRKREKRGKGKKRKRKKGHIFVAKFQKIPDGKKASRSPDYLGSAAAEPPAVDKTKLTPYNPLQSMENELTEINPTQKAVKRTHPGTSWILYHMKCCGPP